MDAILGMGYQNQFNALIGQLLDCLNLNGKLEEKICEPIGRERHHRYKVVVKRIKEITERRARHGNFGFEKTIEVYSSSRALYDTILQIKEESSLPSKWSDYSNHAEKITTLLKCIVSSSHNFDNRRLQISFGLLEVIAELFVLNAFLLDTLITHEKEKCYQYNKNVLKYIGNSLTNLTFENLSGKIYLATNKTFMSELKRTIIGGDVTTVQVFGGLVRNLSWIEPKLPQMCEITASLSDLVPILTRIVTQIYPKDMKCLNSVLSALWNLASHSETNKQLMCSERFLFTVLKMLEEDSKLTELLKNATGVFKYLAGVIKNNQKLLTSILNCNCISLLAVQLNSSSTDIVQNSLYALDSITSVPYAAQVLLQNHDAFTRLKKLSDCKMDTISETARSILSNVYNLLPGCNNIKSNEPLYLTMTNTSPEFPLQSVSICNTRFLSAPSQSFHGKTSTPLRPHPEKIPTTDCNDKFSFSERFSNTFPKHVHNNSNSILHTPLTSYQATTMPKLFSSIEANNSTMVDPTLYTTAANVQDPQLESFSDQFITEPYIEAGQLTPSLQCTRHGSDESVNSILNLTDKIDSRDWASSYATPRSNSDGEIGSDVDESNLPASPSEYANLPRFDSDSASKIPESKSSTHLSTCAINDTSPGEKTGDLDAVVNSKLNYNAQTPSKDDIPDETLEGGRLLDNAIEAHMPKPNRTPMRREPLQPNFSTTSANKTSPQNSQRQKHKPKNQLLESSIAAVMPKPSGRITTKKNSVNSGHINNNPTTASHHTNTNDDPAKTEFPSDISEYLKAEQVIVDCDAISAL